jgi:hypothetical protein
MNLALAGQLLGDLFRTALGPFRVLTTDLRWVLERRALRKGVRHCSKELNMASFFATAEGLSSE